LPLIRQAQEKSFTNCHAQDFGGHIKYMSSISFQNFNSIDDDHKELSLLKETDFKIEAETLDT